MTAVLVSIAAFFATILGLALLIVLVGLGSKLLIGLVLGWIIKDVGNGIGSIVDIFRK